MARFNKMPPETFRLPSGGVTYTNGELDEEVVNGEVLVYPMTTVDEITMRSPDMLFQGSAIEKVFQRCMPQIKKPMDLLSNDVDYLLVCLRMVTYGSELDIYWNCPKCGNDKEIIPESSTDEHRIDQRREGEESSYTELVNVKPTYQINLNKFLRDTVPFDPNLDDYKFTVATGEEIELRPSTFKEMLTLFQYDMTKIETPEEMADFIIDTLLSVIKSVNGVTNKEHIREWALACEAPVIDEMQEYIQVANDWGTSKEYEFKCKKCSYESKTEIPLNPIHFFTVPSTKKTKQ
jgi:hypothetical protein